MRRLDIQLRETRKKLAAAVKASGTTLTEIFGAGPVIAGTVIGDVADVSRFPGRIISPLTTAPPPSRCSQETGRSTGCRCAAAGA